MATRYPFVGTDMSQLSLGQPAPGARFVAPGPWAQRAQAPRTVGVSADQKHKEYLKQQERLRFMAASARKAPVSADALIENLMGKEETFKPKTHHVAQAASSASAGTGTGGGPQQLSMKPQWLVPSSAQFPALYRAVWSLVGQPSGLADTSRLSSLLLSSGLPTEVLGYIWGVANQSVPGHLTEHETYLVLALVALAQTGCTFNSVSVLNLIPQPPVPNLTLPFAVPDTKQPSSISTLPPQQPSKAPHDNSNLTSDLVRTNSSVTADDNFDDFTDFQSAVVVPPPPVLDQSVHHPPSASLQTPNMTSETKCEIPVVQKFPSVMVAGSTSRGVGSRLANHSLGAPKISRSKHHKHHRHQHQSSNQQPTDDDFSEFQQAKSPPAIDELFPKCGKKSSHSTVYTLKESAIRVEEEISTTPTTPELLVFDESVVGSVGMPPVSITTTKSASLMKEDSEHDVAEKPVLATKEKPASATVTEDRYSALRDLFSSDDNREPETDVLKTTVADDFGDFHSADDLFANLAKREAILGSESTALCDDPRPEWNTSAAIVSSTNVFTVNWGASGVQDEMENKSSVLQDQASSLDGSTEQWSRLDKESDLVGSFLALDVGSDPSSTFTAKLETDNDFQSGGVSVSDDVLSLNWSTPKITESGSRVEGFLGQIYSDSVAAKQDDMVIITGQDDDFGEFVGPETWQEERKVEDGKELGFDEPPVGMAKDLLFYDNQSVSSLELPPLTLSRHGSVPSLDLKIYPSAGEKSGTAPALDLSPQGQEGQLNEWTRCLQSCLSLLQSAVDTLGSISSDQVLDEVLGAPEGKGYLQDLHEVYGVCQRVEASYLPLTCNDPKMDSIVASVNAAWTSLQQYYTRANICVWKNQLTKTMSTAVEEEKRIAISNGNVEEGYPYITVIVDGGWCKRSYGHGFSANSGLACVIGKNTKQILYLGVKNKFCFKCSLVGETDTPPAHECNINYSGPSTGMEQTIIVEGLNYLFKEHGVWVKYLIGDGDSSVFARVRERAPFGWKVVKLECANHAVRCYTSKLHQVAGNTNLCSEARKLLKLNIPRLTAAARGAIRESKGNIAQLNSDLRNGPYHVFGEHKECRTTYCVRKDCNETNYIPTLESSKILLELNKCLDILLRKASRLTENVTTNVAENLMSLVSKFAGSKRVDFAKSGSYQRRCLGAALYHAKGPSYVISPWKSMTGRSPGTVTKKVIARREHRRAAKRLSYDQNHKTRPRKKRRTQYAPDSDYGPDAAEIDIDDEEMEKRKQSLLEELSEEVNCEDKCSKMEKNTVGQHDNPMWLDARSKRLTASHFGTVYNMRQTTSCHNTVKSILIQQELFSKSIQYGRMHKKTAIKCYEELKGVRVDPCGLFVRPDLPYLGASPDGTVADDGLVEVKCLPSIGSSTIKEAAGAGKVPCLQYDGNQLVLKTTHRYWFQIQGQLMISKRRYCDLILYSERGIEVVHQELNEEFWKTKLLPKLKRFYMECVLPEIADSRIRRGMRVREPKYILEAQVKISEKKKK